MDLGLIFSIIVGIIWTYRPICMLAWVYVFRRGDIGKDEQRNRRQKTQSCLWENDIICLYMLGTSTMQKHFFAYRKISSKSPTAMSNVSFLSRYLKTCRIKWFDPSFVTLPKWLKIKLTLSVAHHIHLGPFVWLCYTTFLGRCEFSHPFPRDDIYLATRWAAGEVFPPATRCRRKTRNVQPRGLSYLRRAEGRFGQCLGWLLRWSRTGFD